MILALIFWALALYGTIVLIWQCANRLYRKSVHATPMSIVLVVHDVESEIEGLLRTMMVKTAFGKRQRYIVVFDVASRDSTQEIVSHMAMKHHCLEYHRVDDANLGTMLGEICCQEKRICCVYDLRQKDRISQAMEDIAQLFHA